MTPGKLRVARDALGECWVRSGVGADVAAAGNLRTLMLSTPGSRGSVGAMHTNYLHCPPPRALTPHRLGWGPQIQGVDPGRKMRRVEVSTVPWAQHQ